MTTAHVALRSDGRWLAIEAMPDHDTGYACVVCARLVEPDEHDVLMHDEIPHPTNMLFDEEDNPQ